MKHVGFNIEPRSGLAQIAMVDPCPGRMFVKWFIVGASYYARCHKPRGHVGSHTSHLPDETVMWAAWVPKPSDPWYMTCMSEHPNYSGGIKPCEREVGHEGPHAVMNLGLDPASHITYDSWVGVPFD